MPVYMDSLPHQSNQVPFPQCYHPSYDSWPHGGNYGYPIPCHGCYNHANFPGYFGFRPTLAHFSPPVPFYYCGHHLPFSEPYPVHYAPPPHHLMEQQRYEYDKDPQRYYHCCGCPHHVSNQKNDKSVEVEEQEPEIAKRSDSLVPLQLNNYSYPTMWIPPNHVKRNDEHSRPLEPEVADQDPYPWNTKSFENMKSFEREPRVGNGWFPLDMDNLRSLMQGKDEKRNQNQHIEDRKRQFSNPIIWMPSNNVQREAEKDQREMNNWLPLDRDRLRSLMQGQDEKIMEDQQNQDKVRQFQYPIFWMPFKSEQGDIEKEDKKNVNAAPAPASAGPSAFKCFEVKPSESDDRMKKVETHEENVDGQDISSQMMESSAKQKSKPVKQVVVHKQEGNSEGGEKKVAVEVSSGSSKQRQPSSSPKASKLPPVCLRLEPLPWKKNGNGKSRSPSHPGMKRQPQEETPKPCTTSSLKEKTPQSTASPDVSLKTREVVEPKRAEGRVIDIVDGKTCENKNGHLRSGSQMENPLNWSCGYQDVTQKSSSDRDGKGSDESEVKQRTCERETGDERGIKENKEHDSAVADDGVRKADKKNLSDVEAAVLIQSAYRGYEVRKLEPQKKLKQMAEVRQEVAEIRNCIQALESSSGLQKNDKERVVVGEMIMRLLLKLDTIQGLHSSLRDIRKALVKDLVTLQEKLDRLIMRSKELSEEGVFTAKIVDVPNINNEANMQETQNKDMEIAENSSETHDKGVYAKEGKFSQMPDSVLKSLGNETSEPSLAHKEVQRSCEHEILDLKVANVVESSVGEYAANKELQSEAANVDGSHVVITEVQEGKDLHPQLEQPVSPSLISLEKTSSEELMGAKVQDSGFDPNVGIEAKVDGMNAGLDVDESLKAKDSAELPLEVTEDEPPVSKLENDELGGIRNSEILKSEKESNALADPTVPSGVDNMKSEADDNMPSGVDSMKGEADDNMATNVDWETNLGAELPIGVLEEDLVLNNEKTETGKDGISSSGEARCNMATDTTSPTEAEDVTKVMLEELLGNAVPETVKNTPLREASYNAVTDKTSTESKNVVKIMVEELPGNAVIEIEENPPCGQLKYKGVSGATSPSESEDVVKVMADELLGNAVPDENSVLTSLRNNDEENDCGRIDEMPSLELAVTSVALEESEEVKEDEQWQVVDGNKEQEGLDKKPQCIDPESVIDTDKMDESTESEITTKEVIVSAPCSQVSVDQSDMVMDNDKKLIEENAKLRAMMEKLMDAGKEQLNVISHLSERVKDLEKKLSRKQKLRTRRNKKATPAPSSKKFNNTSVNVAA